VRTGAKAAAALARNAGDVDEPVDVDAADGDDVDGDEARQLPEPGWTRKLRVTHRATRLAKANNSVRCTRRDPRRDPRRGPRRGDLGSRSAPSRVSPAASWANIANMDASCGVSAARAHSMALSLRRSRLLARTGRAVARRHGMMAPSQRHASRQRARQVRPCP
jgi:hypothetical protein